MGPNYFISGKNTYSDQSFDVTLQHNKELHHVIEKAGMQQKYYTKNFCAKHMEQSCLFCQFWQEININFLHGTISLKMLWYAQKARGLFLKQAQLWWSIQDLILINFLLLYKGLRWWFLFFGGLDESLIYILNVLNNLKSSSNSEEWHLYGMWATESSECMMQIVFSFSLSNSLACENDNFFIISPFPKPMNFSLIFKCIRMKH